MESYENPSFRSYVDVLLDQLDKHAGRTVLCYLDEDRSRGDRLIGRIDRHAESQPPQLRSVFGDGERAEPGGPSTARQRGARLSLASARRQHADGRRHGRAEALLRSRRNTRDDRAADVAKIDGIVVAPAHIEAPLCALPEVQYAVAVATDDAANGYVWNAVIVPWPGRRIDIARCVRALELACSVKIANAVRMVAASRVPMTGQGKADRAAIGRLCREDSNRSMSSEELVLSE